MGLDWRNIKTRSGYSQPGYCKDCEREGVLRKLQFSNGIWHVFFYCPDCNEKLSGSIAREELRKNGVDMDALPVHDASTNRWERVPPCPDCGLHPQMGKKKISGQWFPVWYCRTCEKDFARVSDEHFRQWHRTLEELFDVSALFMRGLPYDEYLETSWWKRVTWARKWIAGFKCELCGATDDLNSHHNSYARKGCERPEDLIVLCRTCHETYHGITEKGEKDVY